MKTPADAGGHTPGPWQADGFEINKEGLEPKGSATVWHVAGTSYSLADPDTRRANARLIAAAPELLEALKDCLGYVISDYESRDGGFGGAQESVDRARAAIAKAEGK